MIVDDNGFTGKWKTVPEEYYGNKKGLRYNRVFVPDGSRYTNYFLLN